MARAPPVPSRKLHSRRDLSPIRSANQRRVPEDRVTRSYPRGCIWRSRFIPFSSLLSPLFPLLLSALSCALQVLPETMTQIATRERRCPLSSQVSPCISFSNHCISNIPPLYSFFFFLSFFSFFFLFLFFLLF